MKMKYKAIFFDRDNTLTYFNTEKESWRDEIITAWSGKPFELSYEKMMHLFKLAAGGKKPWYKNLDEALSIFSKHQDYAATNEEKRGIYLREYTVLKEFARME